MRRAVQSVVISGWYGHDNAGDEAILQQFIAEMAAGAGAQVRVLSERPERIEALYGGSGVQALRHVPLIGAGSLPAWRNGDFWRHIQALKDAGLFVLGGGGLLRDDTSAKNIWRLLDEIWLAKLFGVPAAVYAAGAGPFQSAFYKRIFRLSLSQCGWISVRDETSKKELTAIGVPEEKITVAADPALLLEPQPLPAGPACEALLAKAREPETIGLFLKVFDGLHHLAKALDVLHSQYGLRFVAVPLRCHQYGGDDRDAACLLRRQMRHPEAVYAHSEPLSAAESKWLAGRFAFNISVRLHGLIFSAAMETPAVAVAYDAKVRNFAASMGLQDHVVEVDANLAPAAVEKALSCRSQLAQYRRHLKAVLPAKQEAAKKTFACLKQLLMETPAARKPLRQRPAGPASPPAMDMPGLFKRSFVYLLGNVASRAVGFFMIPIYARFLRPSEYGIIELLELCTQFMAVSVGLQAAGGAMTRIYYEYKTEQERRRVISSSLLGSGLLSAVLTAMAVALSGSISRTLFGSAEYVPLVCAAFVAMSFSTVGEIVLVYQRIRDRSRFFVGYSLAQLIFTLLLNVYFIAFLKKGIWGFVISKLIAGGLGCLVLAAMAVREVGISWRMEPVRRMVAFGSPMVLASLSFFIIHFSDRFFLGHFADLASVGIYALAYKFAFLVTYLVGEPFGRVWNVSLYSYLDRDGWKDHVLRIARYLVFVLFCAGLAVSLFVDQLLAVVASPAFASAAHLVPLLALGYVFREIGDFFRNLLYINKRSGRVGQITLACAVLNLVLNDYLIARLAASGAAWATLLTWAAYMIMCWLASEAEYALSFSFRSLGLLAALSTGIYYCGKYYCGKAASLSPLPAQWGQDALLLFTFLGLVWLCRYFPTADRKQIAYEFSKWRARVI
jgi:polysaccharide pyruvyl transferase CsaB